GVALVEARRLAEVRARLACDAVADVGPVAARGLVGIAPPDGQRGRHASADRRASRRGRTDEPCGPAVDPDLVAVEAADRRVPLATLRRSGTRGPLRGARGGAIGRRHALQAEGRAVEARQLALLAVKEVRPRPGAPGLVAVLDVGSARTQGAGGLPVANQAFLL